MKKQKRNDIRSLGRCLPCSCGGGATWGAGFLLCEKCGYETCYDDGYGAAVREWNKNMQLRRQKRCQMTGVFRVIDIDSNFETFVGIIGCEPYGPDCVPDAPLSIYMKCWLMLESEMVVLKMGVETFKLILEIREQSAAFRIEEWELEFHPKKLGPDGEVQAGTFILPLRHIESSYVSTIPDFGAFCLSDVVNNMLFRFPVGSIDNLVSECHKIAVDHGWWDSPREDGTCIALMHSELSEALEWLRKGDGESDHIPPLSGIEEELADVLIRIFDFAGSRGLRLEAALESKIEFNRGRPYRHGGKKI